MHFALFNTQSSSLKCLDQPETIQPCLHASSSAEPANREHSCFQTEATNDGKGSSLISYCQKNTTEHKMKRYIFLSSYLFCLNIYFWGLFMSSFDGTA